MSSRLLAGGLLAGRLFIGALPCLLAACQTAPPGASPEATRFGHLPGWSTDKLSEAMPAFRLSCQRLTRFGPETNLGGMPDGTGVLAAGTIAGTWAPVCAAAAIVPDGDDMAARAFFEKHLEAHAMSYGEGGRALFTGYYEPEVAGSRQRGGVYQTPLYRRPGNLVQAATGPDPRGLRLGQFTKLKFSGRSLGNKLDGFHAGILTQRTQRTQSFAEKITEARGQMAEARNKACDWGHRTICCASGESGGGPPHSRTLRADRAPQVNALRLGLRQPSGALDSRSGC